MAQYSLPLPSSQALHGVHLPATLGSPHYAGMTATHLDQLRSQVKSGQERLPDNPSLPTAGSLSVRPRALVSLPDVSVAVWRQPDAAAEVAACCCGPSMIWWGLSFLCLHMNRISDCPDPDSCKLNQGAQPSWKHDMPARIKGRSAHDA